VDNVSNTLLVVRNKKKQRDQRSQCILSYCYERHKDVHTKRIQVSPLRNIFNTSHTKKNTAVHMLLEQN